MGLVVYDIETRHLVGDAHPVTGQTLTWGHVEDLGMCVACTWSEEDGFLDWLGDEAPELLQYLIKADLAVSFNGFNFDNLVLWGACDKPTVEWAGHHVAAPHAYLEGRMVDLLQDVRPEAGRLVSLDALAGGTLGEAKDFHAELAPRKWAKGKRLEVIQYCRRDVDLTRRLFMHGLEYGVVHYLDKHQRRHTLTAKWTVRDFQGRVVRALARADMDFCSRTCADEDLDNA